MDKDSQFNMIVYVRKNNYMEGSVSATIKIKQKVIPPAVAIRGHFNWKEKWIKGLISEMWLKFLYAAQLLISDICTKFHNSRSSSSGEIFDENFHMHYFGVRD